MTETKTKILEQIAEPTDDFTPRKEIIGGIEVTTHMPNSVELGVRYYRRE